MSYPARSEGLVNMMTIRSDLLVEIRWSVLSLLQLLYFIIIITIIITIIIIIITILLLVLYL